jgi:hypothetical protein
MNERRDLSLRPATKTPFQAQTRSVGDSELGPLRTKSSSFPPSQPHSFPISLVSFLLFYLTTMVPVINTSHIYAALVRPVSSS